MFASRISWRKVAVTSLTEVTARTPWAQRIFARKEKRGYSECCKKVLGSGPKSARNILTNVNPKPALPEKPGHNRRQKVFNRGALRFFGGLCIYAGGLVILKIEKKLHWSIVFHVSTWGGLELCLGGLSPPKPPVATGLSLARLTTLSRSVILQTLNFFLRTSLDLFLRHKRKHLL